MPLWIERDPHFHLNELGFLLDILDNADSRSVKEQLGGYHPRQGMTLDPETLALTYPGDPPFKPSATIQIGKEFVVFYRYGSWLAIIQPDDSFEVARVDFT